MAPFRYESSVDPRQSATIADLMLRRGDIAAHAAQQNGAVWNGAAQNIGQMIGALPGQIALGKRADLQDQIGAQQLQDMKANAADRAELHGEQDTARHQAMTSQIGLALHDRLRPDDPTNNLQAMQEALDAAEHHKLITPEQAQQFGAMASADPAKIPEVAKSWAGLTAAGRAEIEKTITAKPGEVVMSRWDNKPVGTPIPEARKTQAELAADAANPNSPTQAQSATALDLMRPPAPPKVETRGLDVQAADALARGDTETYARLLKVKKAMAESGHITVNVPNGQRDDVKESIAGMKDGTLPPQMPGRASKDYTALMAEAHRQGYDLAAAVSDWSATQKHIATMNGSKFTALRSSIDTAYDSLDVIDELAKKWDAGRFPVLNKGNLALAKAGAYGKDAASIASQLDGQITDVTSEIANVYMGGNSPTDHALKLAEKNLSASWDKKVLLDMTQLARKNLQIRKNSITHSAPAGLSSNEPAATAAPAAAVASAPTVGLTPGLAALAGRK